MTTLSEFIVNGFIAGYAGEQKVIGRCGDRSIRVGDLFDTLRDKIDGPKQVRLEVVAIQAYGRNLQELGTGMTGTIDVRGDGVELLRPSSVLVASLPNRPITHDTAASLPAAHA